MKKGEIWIVELPQTDSREQHGTRPVIILTDTKSSVAIIIPCTSNLQALRLPHTIRIEASKQNGLAMPTIALVLQLRAIDKIRLQKKIGVLEKPTLDDINSMIRELLDV